LFTGKPFVGTDSNYRSGGQGQGLRRYRLIRLSSLVLRCCLALVLRPSVALWDRLILGHNLVCRRLRLRILLLLLTRLDFGGLILLSRYA
jgi:hypothetical protein